MIENLIERVKKEFIFIKKRPKYNVKLTLAEMFFYVKWFGKNFFLKCLENHSFSKETRGILQFDMVETLAQRVRDVLMDGDNNLTLEDLTLVASMAEHGLLGFLDSMVLKDLDLSTIPTDQLAPLFSSVTRRVDFWNISGCGPFMDILKCDVVGVFGQSLGTEETRALVRAMETRVRMVTLGGCVTLDTEALLQYSGQGRCGKLAWSYQTEAEEELRLWAFRKKWTVRNNLELARNSDINHRLVVSIHEHLSFKLNFCFN